MTYQPLRDGENLPDSSSDSSSTDVTPFEVETTAGPRLKVPDFGSWLSGPRGLLLGLALGLGLAFATARISGRTASPTPSDAAETVAASATVTVAESQTAPIRQTINSNGTVEAADLLAVAPKANGLQIQSIAVDEGDVVSAGQVLAVLDDSVLRSQLAQAEAQVMAGQAQVNQAQAQVTQARADLAAAEETLDRYEQLFDSGAISAEELTQRRTQVNTTRQQVEGVIASVASAEAQVRGQEAAVNQLETQLDQTLVLAPADGIIAEKLATIGDTASTSAPLFRLIDNGQLELAIRVPQAQLPSISSGMPVQIRSTSDPDLQLQGQVRAIDPTVDPQTRQATVEVSLPGSDKLRPGMFLQAAIVTGQGQGVVVPADAVLPQSSGGFVVYTLTGAENRTAQARTVSIGERIPARGNRPAQIEITTGLEAGIEVIVEGASYVQDGDTVALPNDPPTDLEGNAEGDRS